MRRDVSGQRDTLLTMKKNLRASTASTIALVLVSSIAWAAGDLTTKFTNQGTIANTRHNLTQRPQDNSLGLTGANMDPYRNDYQQVCVYCHTPHAANQNVEAPLWNRTARTTTYATYNQLTLSQDATQPGPNSLTCLSCHDGQTAVDSIVNMPGSGGYNPELALDPSSTTTDTLLNAWTNTRGADATVHAGLNSSGCLACHTPSSGPGDPLNIIKAGATDFSVFAIGTDLRNDHPVGVQLPTGSDWNTPNAVFKNVRFFDKNGNSRPDKNEVRFYNSGGGYEVECASCHDPHGVPGSGSTFLPTFLRVTVDGSTICMTCHVK